MASTGGETVLSGTLPDQPALHGVFDKVRDLGLCIVMVRRLPPQKKQESNDEPHAHPMTSQQTSRRSRRSALRSLGRVRVLDGGDLPQRPPVELLVEHFTVYVHDRRGRGDSTDTQPYAIQREVEGLAALIAHAGRPASVYGMSSGCRWPCTQQPKGW